LTYKSDLQALKPESLRVYERDVKRAYMVDDEIATLAGVTKLAWVIAV